MLAFDAQGLAHDAADFIELGALKFSNDNLKLARLDQRRQLLETVGAVADVVLRVHRKHTQLRQQELCRRVLVEVR